MNFAVLFTDDAIADLQDLYDYICEHDHVIKAEKLLDKLEEACARLVKFPERGNYPKELLKLGIREYREINITPYRILYRVMNTKVYIHLITDGRRSMQTLLQQRFLEREL